MVYLGAVVDTTVIRVRIVRVSDLVGTTSRVKLVTIVETVTVGVLGQRVGVTGLAVRIELVVLERVLRTVDLVTVVDAIAVGVRVVRVGAVFLLLVVGQAILIRISRTIILTRLITRLRTHILPVERSLQVYDENTSGFVIIRPSLVLIEAIRNNNFKRRGIRRKVDYCFFVEREVNYFSAVVRAYSGQLITCPLVE